MQLLPTNKNTTGKKSKVKTVQPFFFTLQPVAIKHPW